MMNSKNPTLIVLPQSLQKRLFDHYHSVTKGRNMDEYKILYRMRYRFYWTKIRDDIKTWVQSCAHCTTYSVWRNRKSELYFSWPISTPLWIMHIDIWCPGQILHSTGNKGHLMNVMYNLTKFVVSTPTYNITTENLEKLFMEEVFLNFGTCAVIVIDDGSNFRGNYQTMRKALKIPYWCI